MFEFNGYLTGVAEDFYYKDSAKKVRLLELVLFLSILPGIFFYSVFFKKPIIFIVYLIIATIYIILPGILSTSQKGRLQKRKTLPNKVYCDGSVITSVSDSITVTKSVSEAKLLTDYDDFYVIKFPGFKTDEKFICQKILFTAESLEEFEKIFDGKIKKR